MMLARCKPAVVDGWTPGCGRLLRHVVLITWCTVISSVCAENVIMIDDVTGEMQSLISQSKFTAGIDNPGESSEYG